MSKSGDVTNKSLKYIINRIKDGNCNNMTKEEFSDMRIIPFFNIFEMYPEGTVNILENNEGTVCADLRYNPNVEFDYFTLETCYCDGTLMFMNDLMMKIIDKIINLKTCYSPTLKKYTNGIDFNKHKIHYTVGDFVINSYIVKESPDPNRPWMIDKFTVMLPIKFEIEEKNDDKTRCRIL